MSCGSWHSGYGHSPENPPRVAQPLLSHILLGAIRATQGHGFGRSSLALLRGSFLSPRRRDNVESGVTTGGKEEAVTSNGHEGRYASTANDFR